MRITIVAGFFLPMPPVSGGATEKSWSNLAREFSAQGHTVTVISRRWPGLPNLEIVDGVHHLRLPGWNHRPALWQNLLLDFWWSWRVYLALPEADIVVVNAVALPVWLGIWFPPAGRVVIMTGRMPKGQYRQYRRVARVLAASSYVRERVLAENPGLTSATRVVGYPIPWQALQAVAAQRPKHLPNSASVCTIGYVGRIHEEKGLALLADALVILARRSHRPAWRFLLCGPVDVARGGSGPEYCAAILDRITPAIGAERVERLEPQFDEQALAGVYQRIDVFCYPSLAAQGETFGVAVAEAMAAGAVPVVSRLACFTDFVRDGANGRVFDHTAPNAPELLADALEALVRDPAARQQLSATAGADVRRYDYGDYATSLLADFAQLTASTKSPSSAP